MPKSCLFYLRWNSSGGLFCCEVDPVNFYRNEWQQVVGGSGRWRHHPPLRAAFADIFPRRNAFSCQTFQVEISARWFNDRFLIGDNIKREDELQRRKKGNKNWVVAADVSRTIKRVATFDIVHLFVSEKAIGRGPLEEFRQVDHRRLDLSPRSDDLQPQPPEEIYLCASLIVVHHCNGSAHSSVDLPFSWKRKTKTMSATIYMHEQANKFLWAGVARDGGEMQLSHRDN